MELLTDELRKQLLENGRANAERVAKDGNTIDFKPVVKFFYPLSGATWLFTELDEDGDRLFGLCDLGLGMPELGYASLYELSTIVVRGISIERDLYFEADKTLTEYADAARNAGRIIA